MNSALEQHPQAIHRSMSLSRHRIAPCPTFIQGQIRPALFILKICRFDKLSISPIALADNNRLVCFSFSSVIFKPHGLQVT